VKSDNTLMPLTFTRTLRLKIRSEAYAWLDAAAIEVNQVFNYCNETSLKAATRTDIKRKWMSGFDLCLLTAGASQYFDKIGADTIQSVCTHYAQKRRAARRLKLRWRISSGPRRSLGWIPFKAASLKRKGVCLRFAGKCVRVFEPERLEGVQWQGGCFAQDAVGDWWLWRSQRVNGTPGCNLRPRGDCHEDGTPSVFNRDPAYRTVVQIQSRRVDQWYRASAGMLFINDSPRAPVHRWHPAFGATPVFKGIELG
jgi:hypothetical protein